jgi:hypothetical protein
LHFTESGTTASTKQMLIVDFNNTVPTNFMPRIDRGNINQPITADRGNTGSAWLAAVSDAGNHRARGWELLILVTQGPDNRMLVADKRRRHRST